MGRCWVEGKWRAWGSLVKPELVMGKPSASVRRVYAFASVISAGISRKSASLSCYSFQARSIIEAVIRVSNQRESAEARNEEGVLSILRNDCSKASMAETNGTQRLDRVMYVGCWRRVSMLKNSCLTTNGERRRQEGRQPE